MTEHTPHPTLPTLYWASGSIPSWQVMLLLYEKRVEFHPHRLKLMSTRETKLPEFLALNPRGETPTWVESDGRVIYESKALMLYLNERYPEPDLSRRAHLADHGLILQRIFELENLRAAYRPIEQLFVPAHHYSADEIRMISEAPQRVHDELQFWERALQGDYLIGDALSLADCCLYPVLGYQVRRGLDLSELPKLNAYLQRIYARPAAKLAHPHGWDKPTKRNLFKRARELAESLRV